MKLSETTRGFLNGNFEDASGHSCSIQESSRFSDKNGSYLWLGLNGVEPIYMDKYKGWQKIRYADDIDPASVMLHDRMHLSQEDVKQLLPLLQYFAEHGMLPNPTVDS